MMKGHVIDKCNSIRPGESDLCVTYRAHLGGNEIAEPVEPLDVRLEIASLLHVFERSFHVGILFGESLDEFLGSNER
jgi:hypothetical protein